MLLTPEPLGANCAAGGTKIESGIDDDRDGVLDVPGEVDQTSYVCSPAEPSFGEFLGVQIVGGAELACEGGVATTATETTCIRPLLNGLDIADAVQAGDFVCGVVASSLLDSTPTVPFGTLVAIWTGTSWAVSPVTPFAFESITCAR